MEVDNETILKAIAAALQRRKQPDCIASVEAKQWTDTILHTVNRNSGSWFVCCELGEWLQFGGSIVKLIFYISESNLIVTLADRTDHDYSFDDDLHDAKEPICIVDLSDPDAFDHVADSLCRTLGVEVQF